MNELRQTKEYKLSDQGGTYTVPYKGADAVPSKSFIEDQEAAKHYNWSGEKITLVDVEQEELDKAAAEGSKEFWPEDRKDKRNAYHKQHVERDYVEEAKIEIADKVVKHLDDVIFEMVCEEMGKRHVFQSQNYLTEAGMDEFEEQFFEFYHEHHGDILAAIHNKLIY